MNNSASSNPLASLLNFELFNFVIVNQSIQDADLIRQLPFIPGLKEILMLRQVHALEQATVWVLGKLEREFQITNTSKTYQFDNELIGGLSTEQGFYLYGQRKYNFFAARRSYSLAAPHSGRI